MTKTKSEVGVSILLYHRVGTLPPENCNLDCFCSIEQFIAQMNYLKNESYEVISLSEAHTLITGKVQPSRPSVILTFDDGDIGFHDIVLPVLQDMCFPSVLFAVSGRLGQQTEWVKAPNARVPIMTESQLRIAHAANVEIGSHSVSHRKLTHLCREDVLQEVYDSKSYLEDVIGEEVTSFSYPHGDFNREILDVISAAGYKCSVTCAPGFANKAASIFELPRNYITYHDGLDHFISKLGPTYDR
jgi:peptidoglycan/xylan/chitin deacetylase (PgdA/CDA1 family)